MKIVAFIEISQNNNSCANVTTQELTARQELTGFKFVSQVGPIRGKEIF